MIHSEATDLSRELETAVLNPETANLSQLWQLAEVVISEVPEALRLQIAGEIVLHIAEVYVARADSLLSGWARTQQQAESSVTVAGLAELLLRQSMQIDFSDLIEVPDHKYNRASAEAINGDELKESVAGEVDKAAFLEAFSSEIELVETQAHAALEAIAVTEEEDVVGWAEAITRWMQQRGNADAISLVQLQQKIGMPMVEVWLGVLLSPEQQFEFEQRGEFYSLHGLWLRQRWS